ncbi:PKD domain-containing protein [Planctomycetes bacterium K23_9]
MAKRSLLHESLETRHLLAGEGVGIDIARDFNSTGLVGSLSSTISWGDGTQSAGTVTGVTDNNGPLSIKFEYMGTFFNDPARKTLLENAAASVVERFSDDLDAITPNSYLKWKARTFNPLTGAELLVDDLAVAANQLVIYVGARQLGGNRIGEAGPGAAVTNFPAPANATQQNEQAEFIETIVARGEEGAELKTASGANRTQATDIGTWGGFISFDIDTNWHFGASTDGLDDDEVDFSTTVVHEMMHVMGFGNAQQYPGITSSYQTATSGNSFIGVQAKAENGGVNVPLNGFDHFADSVISNNQQSVVSERVDSGTRKVLTPLDIAALDDIGWTPRASTFANVTASHIYADNPSDGTTYPVEIVLRGSQFGELTSTLTNTVTNTPPSLSLPPNQSVEIDRGFTITNLGEILDPGFTSAAAGSTETFTYSINWGDGDTDSGDATIDRVGNGTLSTLASFDGSHTYDAIGTYTVSVTATDDDNGSDTETFSITVTAKPALSLQLSKTIFTEDEGQDAAILTVSRSGPASNLAQTVTLTSSDTSEVIVPATVTIPANASSITTPIRIADDTLLDGTQTATISAAGAGMDSGDINLEVQDAEFLTAIFAGGNITEADTTSVVLRITRSNTDADDALLVNITGGDSQQLTVESQFTIPAGDRTGSVVLTPVQDDQAELTKTLDFVISATSYASANASVDILDDEPPLFQNPENRFDANGQDGLTPADILAVINQLAEEGSGVLLDPEVRPLDGVFYDVDGNYVLTPNDILEVINELAEQAAPSSDVGGERILDENVDDPAERLSLIDGKGSTDVDDDDETRLRSLLDTESFVL